MLENNIPVADPTFLRLSSTSESGLCKSAHGTVHPSIKCVSFVRDPAEVRILT